MMKNFILPILLLFSLGEMTTSCESLEDTYKEYSGDGPIEYLNKVYDLKASSQWEGVKLTWSLKPDPGRTGIMVKWSNAVNADSLVIGKDETSYTFHLTDDYEYTFNVWAVREENGVLVKRSLGNPEYARPFNKYSDAFALFTYVVSKQIKIGDKKIFLVFTDWAENLSSFKISYFEKGVSEQITKEYTIADNKKLGPDGRWFPDGLPYTLLGENVDFSKPVSLIRIGNFKEIGIEEPFSMEPIQLYFDLPSLQNEFITAVRPQVNVPDGDIRSEQLAALSSLELDYRQASLEDVLYCSNLKKLYLDKNRYIMAGTESTTRDTLSMETGRVLSKAALKIAHDELGVEIYQYGKNYFDEDPGFFSGWNLPSELPHLDYLNTTGWEMSETPVPLAGEETGLKNLLVDDATQAWSPLGSKQLNAHVIEVDMKSPQTITGFKLTQANISDSRLTLPNYIKVEYWDDTNTQWVNATFYPGFSIGNGKGESTLIYFDHAHNAKTFQKFRFTVSDAFYTNQWEGGQQYAYYRTALGTFIPFN